MAIVPDKKQAGSKSFETEKERQQKKLIYVFLGVLLIIGAILYLGFFNRKTPVPMETVSSLNGGPLPEQITDNLISALRALNFQDSLLSDEKFQGLVLEGEIPIVVGEKGRKNPFAPF